MVEDNRLPEPPPTPPPPPPQTVDGQTPPPENPGVLYEHTDASFRSIAWIILGSAIVGAVMLYAVMRFYRAYEDYQANIKASHYPLASERSGQLPEEPRLEQINRMANVQKGNVYLREETKESQLRSYKSAEDGYVHIPIDRAMDYLAGKLEVRKDQPSGKQAQRQNGLVDAGASNSGRMFRGDKP